MTTFDETAVQEAIQATIQSIAKFKTARVTINDYSVTDLSFGTAHDEPDPIVVILNSDNWQSSQRVVTPENRYLVRMDLLVPNQVKQADTWNDFRDKRDALVSEFNEVGTNRSPGGTAVHAEMIRNEGPILPVYDVYLEGDDLSSAIPKFWSQVIVMEVNTF